MTFRELIEQLAKRIGQHQLPVNASATELRGFIDSGAVHYELVTQVVTAIYTGNRCRRLADPVTRDATFESIEPIRLALLRSPKTDVDAYALMDGLCAEVARIFKTTQPFVSPTTGPETAGGRLVPFRRRLRIS
ncbi:MAG TPA: hypothetical protein VN277_06410 [Acidiferrobacterales bacterium]|nr:hypothetical protein [Acidiferrobacterales bacterium]